MLYGPILGDMIGAPYEFLDTLHPKNKDVELFDRVHWIRFTDDSIMTLAVAKALIYTHDKSENEIKTKLIACMQDFGRRYPSSYGTSFNWWINNDNPRPYNSWGNGSAMRVSAVGWLYDSLEKTNEVAKWTAEITHNHPEGIKGAQAVASAIYLARTNHSKDYIKSYIENTFNYDLSKTCDEIRPTYRFNESCQDTVPQAIIAFLEGNDFEECLRLAFSLGGDCDTLMCITCSIAEAMYKVPEYLKQECIKRLNEEFLEIIDVFNLLD